MQHAELSEIMEHYHAAKANYQKARGLEAISGPQAFVSLSMEDIYTEYSLQT